MTAQLGPPIGRTVMGVTAWAVPGQPRQHLTRGGPGDGVHLCEGARSEGRGVQLGADMGHVSGPCPHLAAAQNAGQAWLAGREAGQ
jgi:hypothetical protein